MRKRSVTIAAGLLAVWGVWRFGAHAWHPVKERYFAYAIESCTKQYGLEQIHWIDVPAFDARVSHFVAQNPPELAVQDCIRRSAGILMRKDTSPRGSQPTIEFVVTDDHLEVGSPKRQVYYAYIQPTD
ncbi:MAG: hypothetical protein B7Z08_01855 [Sphingomonadales bacterium 32-68-7]|nr:MAG: hypothetical protein B7Z33_08050 [Sphingomonadales bacterium 12-68-11]OYX10237.1 MAG: hypothetical protein B7Z08_01855 [Sphingomonadales bacterium 32-68-7]